MYINIQSKDFKKKDVSVTLSLYPRPPSPLIEIGTLNMKIKGLELFF